MIEVEVMRCINKQLEGKVSGVRPEDAHVNTVY